MKWGQRLVGLLSLLCLGNSPVLFRFLPWAGWQKWALLILLAVFYLAWNIHPCRHAPRGRLTVLQGGYELLLTSLLCLAAQALLLCFWLHLRPLPMDWTQIPPLGIGFSVVCGFALVEWSPPAAVHLPPASAAVAHPLFAFLVGAAVPVRPVLPHAARGPQRVLLRVGPAAK